MGSYLEKIVEKKRMSIKDMPNIDHIERRPAIKFTGKLRSMETMAVIAEFKRASPSKGTINQAADPVRQALLYEQYGAAAISVLTDEHFKGTLDDLKFVRQAVGLPLLCKDFILEEKQIAHAALAGADVVLLIAAIHDQYKLKSLHDYAKACGLDTLVEVHHEYELERALYADAEIIGVNNRNLSTFEVDLGVTERLGPAVRKAGAFLISESGIHTEEDVKRAAAAGANGLLVGEALMSAPDLEEKFRSLINTGKLKTVDLL